MPAVVPGTGFWTPATGDPQTVQKAAPSDKSDPHFAQVAIFPPVERGKPEPDSSIVQQVAEHITKEDSRFEIRDSGLGSESMSESVFAGSTITTGLLSTKGSLSAGNP
jgi:hypothetical protein